MALIPCQECKKEISDKAVACAHCGAPAQSKIKTKTDNYLSAGFSTEYPLVPCRVCQTEVLRKAYVCPNCGIRNPDFNKNNMTNIGLFLFIFTVCLEHYYDTWPRWAAVLPSLWFSVVLLICLGGLWYTFLKAFR